MDIFRERERERDEREKERESLMEEGRAEGRKDVSGREEIKKREG